MPTKAKPTKAKAKPKAKAASRVKAAFRPAQRPAAGTPGSVPPQSFFDNLPAPRGKPSPVTAPAALPERDYLVIFEEPDPYGLPADDTLVLDIEQPQQPARPEVDVQQKVALELTNTTSRLGTFGFGLCSSGAALGVVLMIAYGILYPENWHGHPGVIRTMILVSVASLILMIAGTVLTHYGRRIQARGRLSDVRIVEKSPQSRASLE